MRWWQKDHNRLCATGKVEYCITRIPYTKIFRLTAGIEVIGSYHSQKKAIDAAQTYEEGFLK